MRDSITSFLRKLVPEGRLFVCTNDKHQKDTAIWTNIPCDGIDQAVDTAMAKNVGKNVDIYFTPAVFNSENPAKRQASRATKFKCFFIDIDVGSEDGKYKSKKIVVDRFNYFRKKYDFPSPSVYVESGGGYHMYWALTEEISADEWFNVATAFKNGLAKTDLKTDPTVTADKARVLRLPETKNWKTDPPSECKAVKEGAPISIEAFKEAVTRLPSTEIPVMSTAMQIPGVAPDLGIEGNIKTTFELFDFDIVVDKCGQVKRICDKGGPSEGLWFLGLALAQHSTDPEASAIRVSEKHPDYLKNATLGKLRSVQNQGANAPSCERFRQLGDKSICLKCPHYKKITTPAQLRADLPADVVVRAASEFRNNLAARAAVEPCKPYYRTGTSVIIRSADDEPATVIIAGDFYPTHYTRDRTTNEHCTNWRLKTDRLTCDFNVPNASLADSKELLTTLHRNGVPINVQRAIQPYMVHYINQLNSHMASNAIISTVGWSDDFKEFSLGSVVYKSDGSSESHEMDANLKGFVPGLDEKKGTLKSWTDMMQFYTAKDHEPHRFMIYSGFASPLYHMTGHDGVSIFASGKSGVGKTTALLAVCSIWGDPKKLKQNGTKNGSTPKARNRTLAAFKNIPACFDDMSNLTSTQLSSFALNISQGRDTATLTASRNAREVGTWSMISQISSNNNAYERMMRDSTVGGAETMRVFQIAMELSDAHTIEEANRFANVDIGSNFGHAGHIFMQYVVKNYDKVKEDIHKTIVKIDHIAKTGSAERFWVAAIACAYVAGEIAIELGLLKWDTLVKDIMWAIMQIDVAKKQSEDNLADPVEILRSFINRNASAIVIISDPSASNRIGSRSITVAEHIPKGPIYGREVRGPSHELYISRAEIKRHCGDHNVSFSAVENDLMEAKVLKQSNVQKTLGAGVDELPKGQTRCWVIDGSKL